MFIYVNTEIKSATRILDILELLSVGESSLRLREVVTILDLPKSSTYGLLMTLVKRGYVVKDANEGYCLSSAYRSNATWVAGFEARLKAIALPIMNDASVESGETVFLGIRNQRHNIRVICKVVSRQPIRYDAEIGHTIPTYASVMGRVLLAFDDADVIDGFFARTDLRPLNEHTITDEARLRQILSDIYRDGFGEIVEEYAIGGCGIAVPIRDDTNKVIAAMDIATVTQRYLSNREQLLEIVKTAALRLSRRLGYRGDASQEGV